MVMELVSKEDSNCFLEGISFTMYYEIRREHRSEFGQRRIAPHTAKREIRNSGQFQNGSKMN